MKGFCSILPKVYKIIKSVYMYEDSEDSEIPKNRCETQNLKWPTRNRRYGLEKKLI